MTTTLNKVILATVLSIPNGLDRQAVQEAVVKSWMREDPKSAMGWLATSGTFITVDVERDARDAILRASQEDPAAAISLASSLPPRKDSALLRADLFRSWFERSPNEAWSAALDLPAGLDRAYCLRALAVKRAITNLSELEYLTKLMPSQTEQRRLTYSAFTEVARRDPVSALTASEAITDPAVRDEALRRVITIAAKDNAQNLADYIAANISAPRIPQIVTQSALAVAKTTPDQIIPWLDRLPRHLGEQAALTVLRSRELDPNGAVSAKIEEWRSTIK